MKLKILIICTELLKCISSQLDGEYIDEPENYWISPPPPERQYCQTFKTIIEPPPFNGDIYRLEQNYYETVSCRMIEGDLLLISSCTKCKILEVSDSDISTIQANAFIDMKTIEEIYMANNKIEKIGTGAFLGLLNLKILHLEMNNISKIARGSFNSLVLLKYLNLSKNNIDEIENEAFHGSISIEILDLSYNNLTAIPEGLLEQFRFLRVLNISNNFLETIGENLCHVHLNLRYLMLNNNNLSKIDCLDSQIPLIELALSNNSLRELNVSILPRTLTKLWLSKNNRELIEHIFSESEFGIFEGLNDLSTLDMSENNISDFDSNFFLDLKYLTMLNISGNDLSNLRESTFKGLTSLATLDLSKNNIHYIPLGFLKIFVNLKSLLISGNQIKYLESGVFNDLHQLTFLDISKNDMGSIESHIFLPLKALKSLNLSYNKLSSLNISELLHFCPDLESLDIDGNSFPCRYLASIFSNGRSSRFRLKYGHTKLSENINGIGCGESENSISKNAANSQSNVIDLNIAKFFNEDFRRTAFFKYFDNVDRFSKRGDPQDSSKKIISLLETLQNKISQNLTDPVGQQEFLNLDNTTFKNLMDKLSVFVENVTNKEHLDSNMSLFQSALESEMEKLIKFENSSNQLFMQEFSRVLHKLESEQIANVEFSKLNAPKSENEEKRFDDIRKESISNIMALTSETRDLVGVLSQIKLFLVLGVLILITICSVRLYHHLRTYHKKCFKNNNRNHEMPVLIPLNQ